MNKLYGVIEKGKILRTFTFPVGAELPSGVEPQAQELPPGVSAFTHFFCDRTQRFKPIPGRPEGAAWQFDHTEGAWVANLDIAWATVRAQRDARLAACDWVALRANERGEPVPAEWLAYRQALRDITQQADPLAVAWPAAPG